MPVIVRIRPDAGMKRVLPRNALGVPLGSLIVNFPFEAISMAGVSVERVMDSSLSDTRESSKSVAPVRKRNRFVSGSGIMIFGEKGAELRTESNSGMSIYFCVSPPRSTLSELAINSSPVPFI